MIFLGPIVLNSGVTWSDGGSYWPTLCLSSIIKWFPIFGHNTEILLLFLNYRPISESFRTPDVIPIVHQLCVNFMQLLEYSHTPVSGTVDFVSFLSPPNASEFFHRCIYTVYLSLCVAMDQQSAGCMYKTTNTSPKYGNCEFPQWQNHFSGSFEIH
jgi:hypothetical protein